MRPPKLAGEPDQPGNGGDRRHRERLGSDQPAYRGSDQPVGPAGDPRHVYACFDDAPLLLFECAGPDRVLVAMNRQARIVTGDRPDIIGRPVAEIFPEMAGQQLLEPLAEVYASGTPVTVPESRLLLHERGDGHLVERFFSYTFAPVRRRDGSMRGVLVTGTEVTDQVQARKAAEAQAAAAEERYQAAHEVVLNLQRHLLPDGVPVLPRARLAAHYAVANAELAAGGDWFDAVPLPRGRVGLVVGDVVGHGPEAAAAMAQLRAVAREALLTGASPAAALARLDSFAARTPGTRAATAGLAVLDPATGALCYAGAGHPTPLLLGPGGRVTFLAADPPAAAGFGDVPPHAPAGHPARTAAPVHGSPAGGPLGEGCVPFPAATTTLAPDELVLLYTDGLVERPGRALGDGLRELATVAGAALGHTSPTLPQSPADRVAHLVVERMARTGYLDDVTVLAAHRLPEPAAGLEMDIPVRIDALVEVRTAVADWLTGLGAGSRDVHAVQLAVWEAATNAIVHAQPRRRQATVTVTVDLDAAGAVRAAVTDRGYWTARRGRDRAPGDGAGAREGRVSVDHPSYVDPATRGGRGLALIRAMSDEMEIDRTDNGTTVRFRRTLTHPAVIGSPTGTARLTGLPALGFRVTAAGDDPPLLTVTGPVDAMTVPELESRMLAAGRGGTRPVVVDLSAVTMLASAGVRLLHELAAATDGSKVGFRLIAPADCPTRDVLRITGLDDLVEEPAVGGAGTRR